MKCKFDHPTHKNPPAGGAHSATPTNTNMMAATSHQQSPAQGGRAVSLGMAGSSRRSAGRGVSMYLLSSALCGIDFFPVVVCDGLGCVIIRGKGDGMV